MATLAIYRGNELQRRLELGTIDLRVGRAHENDLVLEDPEKGVSRSHAELRFEQGHYVIVDLNSQNGVWIGDRRVTREILTPEVPVSIGPYRLVLETAPDRPTTDEITYTTLDLNADVAEPTLRSEAGLEPTPLPPRPVQPPPQPAPRPPRKPISIALMIAAVVVGMLVVVLVAWRRGDRSVSRSSDVVPAAEPAANVDAQERERQQRFDDALRRAKAAFDANEKGAAVAAIDEALALQANNQGALEWRSRILQLPDAPTQPPGGSPEESSPKGPAPESIGSKAPESTRESWPPDLIRIPKLTPNESLKNRLNRARGLQDLYVAAQRDLRSGNYASAISGLKKILEANKLDDYDGGEAKRLLGVAEKGIEAEKRRRDAETHVLAAERLAASGNLKAARDEYDKARETDPTFARAVEDGAAHDKKIDALVTSQLSALSTMRKLDPARALTEYEALILLLRPSDQRVQTIKKIMDDLRN